MKAKDLTGIYSGAALRSNGVTKVLVHSTGEDGEKLPPRTINLEAILMAEQGEKGFVRFFSADAGDLNNVHVEFVTEQVNQPKEVEPLRPPCWVSPWALAKGDIFEAHGQRWAVTGETADFNTIASPVDWPGVTSHFPAGRVVDLIKKADPAVPLRTTAIGAEAPPPADAVIESTDSVPGGFSQRVTELVRTRGSDYGAPCENHQLTAELWTAWLSRRLRLNVTLSAEDVCMLNILQKQSRLAFVTKDDSWFDVAGYTENVAMLRPEQRNQGK